MDVMVLMMSCHVSLKPKNGPLAVQIKTTIAAISSETGLPVVREAHSAMEVNRLLDRSDFIAALSAVRPLRAKRGHAVRWEQTSDVRGEYTRTKRTMPECHTCIG